MKSRVSMLSPRTAEASEALRATRALHEELPAEIVPRSPIFTQRVAAERARQQSVVQSGIAMDRVFARNEAVPVEQKFVAQQGRTPVVASVVVSPSRIPPPAPQGSAPAAAPAVAGGHKRVEGRLWGSAAQRIPHQGDGMEDEMAAAPPTHMGADASHKRFMAMEMSKIDKAIAPIDEDDYELYMGAENAKVLKQLQPDDTHPFLADKSAPRPVKAAAPPKPKGPTPAEIAAAEAAAAAEAGAQRDRELARAQREASRRAAAEEESRAAKRDGQRRAEMDKASARKAELEAAAAKRRSEMQAQKAAQAEAAAQERALHEEQQAANEDAYRRELEAQRAQRAARGRSPPPPPPVDSAAEDAYAREMAQKAGASRAQRQAERDAAQAKEAEAAKAKAAKEAKWRAAEEEMAREKAAAAAQVQAEQAAKRRAAQETKAVAPKTTTPPGKRDPMSLQPARERPGARGRRGGSAEEDAAKAAKREQQNRELEEEKRRKAKGPSQYATAPDTSGAPKLKYGAGADKATQDFIRQQETKMKEMTADLDGEDADDFAEMMAADNARRGL